MARAVKQILLIDGDLIVYRCGFSVEKKQYVVTDTGGEIAFTTRKEAMAFAALHPNAFIEHRMFLEPVENALHNVNTTIAAIGNAYPTAERKVFLSGRDNFRKDVATIQVYKGNRNEFSKPRYYKELRDHIINSHRAEVVHGMEADDELGIQSTELAAKGYDPIIVTTDKDLDMIVGKHYNWVNKEEYNVDEEAATRAFFGQLLTGDSVDYVPGIKGVGPKTAGEILAGSRRPRAMLAACRQAYRDAYPQGVTRHDGTIITADQALIENGRLLWIKRNRNEELWHPKQV